MMKRLAINIIYLSILFSVFTEYKVEAEPVNINFTNLLLLCGVFVTLYDALRSKEYSKYDLKLLFVSVSFLAFSATSFQIEVGSGVSHLRTVVTLSKGVLVILLMSYWIDSYTEVEKIVTALVWAGLIAFFGAFIQGYFGVGANVFAGRLSGSRLPNLGLNIDLWRASGFLEGYGLLGVYMASAALLSAVGFLSYGRREGRSRVFAFLGVVIALVGFLVAQSRSFLLAMLVGYGVFYVLATFVYNRFTILRAVPLALILGGVFYFGSAILEVIVNINRLAIIKRIEGYWAAATAAANNPIFGVGFSNMYSKLDYYLSIHNAYLNLLAGGGGVAFVLYAYLNVKAIKEGVLCLKASDPRAPLAIGLLSALSAAMVECMLWGGGVFATAVFVILGLLISLGRAVCNFSVNT